MKNIFHTVGWNDSIGVEARPHPNPLPQERELTLAGAGSSTKRFAIPNAGRTSPSPGGEGRGEGGRCLSTESFRLRGKGKRSDAFTLVDLLVVLAVLALLAATLLPALAGGRSDSQSFQCCNNLRQLQRAWLMYADDNNDKLPQNIAANSGRLSSNPLDPNAQPGMPNANWVLGEVSAPPGWTNDLLITHGLIYPYLKSTTAFKCPQDTTVRNRSYSMNCWMNGINPWNATAINYTKVSEFNAKQPPAMACVFIEEHQGSINDGYFAVRLDALFWIDAPASYHDGACGLSFADGRVEIKRWNNGTPSSVADLQWLQARSSTLKPR